MRHDGEAVIDLEEIHIRRLHLRRLKHHLAGALGARQRHLRPPPELPGRMRLANAFDEYTGVCFISRARSSVVMM